MNLRTNVLMAIGNLRMNKVRALLTMLGIIIGIGSVIAILTVGNALSGSVNNALSSFGANNVAVSLQRRGEAVSSGGGPPGVSQTSTVRPAEKDLLTPDMVDAMRRRYDSSIAGVSLTEVVGAGQARDRRYYANITLTGASADYSDINNLTMARGRFLSGSDVTAARDVAVVSDRLVSNLFGGDPARALGQEVRAYVGDQIYVFTIVGVYEYDQSALNVSQVAEKDLTTSLLIPVSTAQRLTGNSGFQSIMVMVQGVDPIAFAEQLETFYARYYVNNVDYTVSATAMQSITEQVNNVLNQLSVGMSVIAGISLVVGGIGVMNIMLVSVTERTREIGLRKAVGATPGNIRLQFIVESVVICLVGGFLGVVVGSLLGLVGSWLLEVPGLPTVGAIGVAVGFSVSIGLFFGYYPANRAARLNPIDALRSL